MRFFPHDAGKMAISQESPRQTKPKKGPKRKVHEFRPFLWILVFFLRKTSTIHIELLFRNAPAKSSWTDLSLVWFAGATSEFWSGSPKNGHFPCITWEKSYIARGRNSGLTNYPLIQNDYRQEKIIFELFSGALQENPVRAPGPITGRALIGPGAHTGDYLWGIVFGGSTGKSCNSPGGNYMKKCLSNYFGNHFAVEGGVP